MRALSARWRCYGGDEAVTRRRTEGCEGAVLFPTCYLLRQTEHPQHRAAIRRAHDLGHQHGIAGGMESALSGDDREVLLSAHAEGNRARAADIVQPRLPQHLPARIVVRADRAIEG